MSSLLYALADWAVRARRLVVIGWLAVLAALGGGALLVSQGLDTTIEIPGTESQEALDRLEVTFPEVSGASAQVIVVAPDGRSVVQPAISSAVAAATEEIAALDDVAAVTALGDELMPASVSADEGAALLTIQLTTDESEVSEATRDALSAAVAELAAALPEGSAAHLGGTLFATELPHLSLVEVVGVVVAFLVLVLALGTVVSASLPLVNAIVGVGLTTILIFGATSVTPISSTTPLLSVMLGLAVGIDYALFIVARHRDNLRDGVEVTESIGRSVATAGSAVVFAGLTVMIALLGLSVAGIPFLTIMGVAAAGGVGVAVLVSLTLLPAMLGFAGDRVLRRRDRGAGAVGAGESRFFAGWVGAATRRPLVTITAVVVVLGAVALPALGLRLALPTAGALPEDNDARITYDLVAEHFGEGFNGPLIVTTPVLTSTDPLGLMDDLAEEIRAVPGVVDVPLATPNPTADTGIIQVVPAGAADSPETEQVVHAIRALHAELEERYGVDIAVTGFTAVGIDVSDKLGDAMLPFALVVIGLSLVLLTVVFRSIWVPVTATIGYLLSVAAAFGAVTLVFEHGWLADAFGVTREGPVISFMPIVLMGILFGLAMDYQVFLVSRMREDFVHGGSAGHAVRTGFLGSSRVVTAAAIIMVSVFVAFVPEGDMNIKPIALGLAVGVAVDAFVVRMTLIPAVMTLLGDRAWWMPRWLDRALPAFDVEGERIAHQIRLRGWAEGGTAFGAHRLRVGSGQETVLPPVTISVADGARVLVTAGDPAAVRAFLLAIAGRVTGIEGDLKVSGYVMPDRAARVRRLVAVVGDAEIAAAGDAIGAVRRAVREGAAIVAVDLLDQHGAETPHGLEHGSLARLLTAHDHATVLVGVRGRPDPGLLAEIRSGGAGVVDLDAAASVEPGPRDHDDAPTGPESAHDHQEIPV